MKRITNSIIVITILLIFGFLSLYFKDINISNQSNNLNNNISNLAVYQPNINDFYSLNNLESFDVDKNFDFNNSILNHMIVDLYNINYKLFELNKYYLVDISGFKEEFEQNRVIINLTTYKNNKIIEQMQLGLNSLYNVIYLTEDYDYIDIDLYVYGSTDITIKKINIKEITGFKTLDSDNYKMDSKNIDVLDNINLYGLRDYVFSLNNDEIINNLKNNIYMIQIGDELIRFSEEDIVDYKKSSIIDRTTQLMLTRFMSVLQYKKIFEETKDQIIIEKYYELVESFIDNNIYNSKEDGLYYNDFATAARVFSLTNFYAYASDYLTKEQKDKLLTSLVYQSNLLAESHFNAKATNHGLYQDLSYLLFLNTICNSYNINYVLGETVNRISDYFDISVSENGVHLEHSPSYQAIMLELALKIIKIYDNISIDSTSLANIADNIGVSLANMTKPDGYYPQIGDTNYKNNRFLNKFSKFQLESVGYQDEGYAIFRNFDNNTYILFYNAYNSYYHKHSDENSIWIYRDGDIIRETGKNGYNYTDPYTKYAYSSWGHNTLIVNDKGLVEEKTVPNDYNYDGTYIESYENDNVTGVTTRYDGVTWKRNVNYDRTNDVVKVKDNVLSSETNKYTFLWHLDSSINPIIDNNKIKLYRDNKLIMTISFNTNSKYLVDIIHGQTEPRILGFSVENNEMVPTNTIKIDVENVSTITFETEFKFES